MRLAPALAALLIIREPGRRFMLVDFRLMQGEEDLHVFLGCHAERAAWLLSSDDEELFVRHLIPKKGAKGGEREVWEVRNDGLADLYKGLARKLDQFIRETLPGFPHGSAHGYITNRSTFTNAKVHVGASKILKADIKSFFKSIHRTKVVTLLTRLGVKERAAAALLTLVVREDHLPLGDRGYHFRTRVNPIWSTTDLSQSKSAAKATTRKNRSIASAIV